MAQGQRTVLLPLLMLVLMLMVMLVLVLMAPGYLAYWPPWHHVLLLWNSGTLQQPLWLPVVVSLSWSGSSQRPHVASVTYPQRWLPQRMRSVG